MNYHPTVFKIKKLLDEGSFWYETFEHEPVRTSEEAAKVRNGYTIDQGAKAIIARVKTSDLGKHFVQIVVSGSNKFDAKKLKEQFGLSDIRFATEDEVKEITDGIVPGGVPPFGNLFGLKVYADKELLKNEKIVFNAGDRRFSIAIKTEDYINIVKPQEGDIVYPVR